MVLCDVIGRVINTFWKVCYSCVQRKFAFVQEWKRWTGHLGSSMQEKQSGYTLFLNFSVSLRHQIMVYTGICKEYY